MTRSIRYGVVAGLVVTGLAALSLLPAGRWAQFFVDLIEWTRGAGGLGVGVFAVVYILSTLLLLPGSALTAGAGFLYGPVWGTVLVSPVSVVAATLAFAFGRSFARDWVAERMKNHGRFAAVDKAIEANGFKIVFLLRLSPVFPFNLLNYALGLTRVRLGEYMVASLLGMLPGTFLYVYLGSLVANASELVSGKRGAAGSWGQVLYWGGLATTLLATASITRIARRALDEALEHEDSPETVIAKEA